MAPAPVHNAKRTLRTCNAPPLLCAAPHDRGGACGQPEHRFHGVSPAAVLHLPLLARCVAPAGSASACQALPSATGCPADRPAPCLALAQRAHLGAGCPRRRHRHARRAAHHQHRPLRGVHHPPALLGRLQGAAPLACCCRVPPCRVPPGLPRLLASLALPCGPSWTGHLAATVSGGTCPASQPSHPLIA